MAILLSNTNAIVIGVANGEGGTVRVIGEKLYYSGFIFEKESFNTY
jgi:hypothetical protein